MTDDSVVDPYGGFREQWSTAVLNGASQRASVVFDKPPLRETPAYNQIVLPDKAHYEACGPVGMACCAYACGYIDDVAATAIQGCQWLGDDAVARNGTNTQQLLAWAASRGWLVHEDTRLAGDVAEDLAKRGLVGVVALETAYGSGAAWNVLHPEAVGVGQQIGHWETVGAVDASAVAAHGGDMTPDKEESLDQETAWKTHESVLGRVPEPDAFAWALGVARRSHVELLWATINGDEFKQTGGLLGHIARIDAQIGALAQQLGADEAKLAQVGQAAVDTHVVAMQQAVSDLQQKMSSVAKAAGG